MGKVVAGATVSLDGYIAGPNESGFEHLFAWFASGDFEFPEREPERRVPPDRALYDKRFILLVRDGVLLPSNLQGLSLVRYKADTLDAEAAMKLLEAIADIKNHPLPGAARP